MIKALRKDNVGYATKNFHLNQGVIIVDKDDKSRKLTMTASWSNGGSVSTGYDEDFISSGEVYPAATVTFDEDEWNSDVTLSITPHYEGVSVIEFTSTASATTLRAVIIVQ